MDASSYLYENTKRRGSAMLLLLWRRDARENLKAAIRDWYAVLSFSRFRKHCGD